MMPLAHSAGHTGGSWDKSWSKGIEQHVADASGPVAAGPVDGRCVERRRTGTSGAKPVKGSGAKKNLERQFKFAPTVNLNVRGKFFSSSSRSAVMRSSRFCLRFSPAIDASRSSSASSIFGSSLFLGDSDFSFVFFLGVFKFFLGVCSFLGIHCKTIYVNRRDLVGP